MLAVSLHLSPQNSKYTTYNNTQNKCGVGGGIISFHGWMKDIFHCIMGNMGSNVFLNVHSDKSQDVSASTASFLTILFLF